MIQDITLMKRANINAVRLSAGVVFHVGTITPPPPVTLACSASPTSVPPKPALTSHSTFQSDRHTHKEFFRNGLKPALR